MLKKLILMLAPASLAWSADAKLERGKYLVEEVGKCQECHTPLNEQGELDKTKWMKGAVLNFAPMKPVQGWHKTAPDLTSSGRLFERWKDEGMVKFMATGLNPRGNKAGPPMPTYKLTQEDAEAVVAYLKSLP
jgi:mono/diheme cytochrome c family protein